MEVELSLVQWMYDELEQAGYDLLLGHTSAGHVHEDGSEEERADGLNGVGVGKDDVGDAAEHERVGDVERTVTENDAEKEEEHDVEERVSDGAEDRADNDVPNSKVEGAESHFVVGAGVDADVHVHV